ncbi:MAG: LysM peptidoglycan-binding domain-containing protein [Chloroflexi bacterium]|nr:LysM peptidoglycan-binding domain-containing protein [Chloroflexota bacterium]
MECFRCDQAAEQECARCGVLYCDDHGDGLCERCMDPALALPSYRVYRGSLVALLVGSVFAVWLLLRPVGGDADAPPAALAAVVPSATAAARASATPTAMATLEVAATALPTSTAVPRAYTVKPGDTLYGIADRLRGSVPLQEYMQRLLQANNLTESSIINAGSTLRVP